MDTSKISEEERIRMVERMYVGFPRFTRISEKIEYCHQHSKIAAEPECLLITGNTGAGKTTLCKAYAGRYPRQMGAEGLMVPVLSTSLPALATAKSVVTRLLSALGDPAPHRGSQNHQTLRLTKLIEECGVELIILDEFQHFIDRDSNNVLQNVANWLKELLNETGVPMILVGMPYSETILRANGQLERRFTVREQLTPFGWESAEQQHEFRMFLQYLDELLPLPARSNLSDQEIAFRIYCATLGITGYVMKLIRRAAVIAVMRSMESVGIELLGEVYEERVASWKGGDVNPFTASGADLKPALLNVEEQLGRHYGGPKVKSRGTHGASGVLSRR
ncbi:MAG: TniB family NTP-binding protein [Blastocatellia bacterium]